MSKVPLVLGLLVTTALVATQIFAAPAITAKVGWVTEYVAGDHITIQKSDGTLETFDLEGNIKILPVKRAAELAVGSRVTIIARRDHATGGWLAFGIVVHPAGSGAGSMPPTPTPTATATPTATPTPTPTLTPTPTPLIIL
jgi:hypothetical protein